jgi:hypothetical protein
MFASGSMGNALSFPRKEYYILTMDKSDIKTFLAKRKQMDKYIKYEKLN